MQELSLRTVINGGKQLSSPPGDALRNDGQADQAAAALEKSEGDLKCRVRSRILGGVGGEGREAFPSPE